MLILEYDCVTWDSAQIALIDKLEKIHNSC